MGGGAQVSIRLVRMQAVNKSLQTLFHGYLRRAHDAAHEEGDALTARHLVLMHFCDDFQVFGSRLRDHRKEHGNCWTRRQPQKSRARPDHDGMEVDGPSLYGVAIPSHGEWPRVVGPPSRYQEEAKQVLCSGAEALCRSVQGRYRDRLTILRCVSLTLSQNHSLLFPIHTLRPAILPLHAVNARPTPHSHPMPIGPRTGRR